MGYIAEMNFIRRFLRFQVRVSALLFLPTAGLLLLVAALWWISDLRFVHSAQHTIGTITSIESRTDEDNTEYFYPHFSFKSTDGSIVEVASKTGSSPAGFEVGDHVPVMYRATDPQSARIATTFQTYEASIILGIIAVVFVPLGFLSRWLRARFFPL